MTPVHVSIRVQISARTAACGHYLQVRSKVGTSDLDFGGSSGGTGGSRIALRRSAASSAICGYVYGLHVMHMQRSFLFHLLFIFFHQHLALLPP